ncbi:transposase, partial [[Ruminococcus] lactaris]|nr:transposase [[Ruminococcus] lactaris]
DKYALRTYVANHKDYFQKLDLETYHALGAFLNSRQLMEINVEKNEREELDMCKALEDIYNDGVQAGMEVGIEQGRQSGIAEGETALKKDVAFQMQKLGYSLDAIAAVLRESVDGISRILAVVG